MILSKRFNNKIAIVTGGADGIGKGVAYRLGQEGATLALFDKNQTLLNSTVEEFKRSGINAKAYITDVSNPSQV